MAPRNDWDGRSALVRDVVAAVAAANPGVGWSAWCLAVGFRCWLGAAEAVV